MTTFPKPFFYMVESCRDVEEEAASLAAAFLNVFYSEVATSLAFVSGCSRNDEFLYEIVPVPSFAKADSLIL